MQARRHRDQVDEMGHRSSPTGSALIGAAQGGDSTAFDELVAPHRDRLRLHCYRMLGSFHDAEDAVQETLLRAWLNIGRFEERSAFGTWLYRIATNTCLNLIRKRPRIVVPGETVSGRRPPAADVAWLEPYPDVHLPAPSADEPEARIEAREATRLAFIATMQLLPARQRAVLILRDVLAWSAAEVADALGTSVPAVNSALQRARARMAEHAHTDASARRADALAEATEVAVDAFVRHWEAGDIDGLVRLLTADAVLAMPPVPAWFAGPDEYRGVPGIGAQRGQS